MWVCVSLSVLSTTYVKMRTSSFPIIDFRKPQGLGNFICTSFSTVSLPILWKTMYIKFN